MRPSTGIYTKVSVVPCHPFYKKTSTFSFKDLRKALSQNVMLKQITVDIANLESFFGKTTLTGVLCYSIYRIGKNEKNRMKLSMTGKFLLC